MAESAAVAEDRFCLSADGLRLHYLEWRGAGDESRAPVVCLAGLTRSAEDFRLLAGALAAQGRRVLALDCRGRGESQWDPDYSHYTLDIELNDILRLLDEAGIEQADFVGTSRGGLQTMLLAQKRPGLVRAAVLNDIGPNINVEGLLGIKRYVGRLPPLNSIEDAIGLMRLTAGASFSNMTLEQWRIFARQSFTEKDGKVVLRYDPTLSHTLDEVKPGWTPTEYWDGFLALARGPLLTLRGENSDILTAEILAEMAERAPRMEIHIVPGQGHPVLLLDDKTISRVTNFLALHG